MKMKTEFRDCATKLSDEFEDTKNTFPGEDYVQVMIQNERFRKSHVESKMIT